MMALRELCRIVITSYLIVALDSRGADEWVPRVGMEVDERTMRKVEELGLKPVMEVTKRQIRGYGTKDVSTILYEVPNRGDRSPLRIRMEGEADAPKRITAVAVARVSGATSSVWAVYEREDSATTITTDATALTWTTDLSNLPVVTILTNGDMISRTYLGGQLQSIRHDLGKSERVVGLTFRVLTDVNRKSNTRALNTP